jgi:polyhydroxybutyrate depolymerase
MLDGRGGTPWTAMKSSGWSVHADAHNFLVAYPEAMRINPKGPLHFLDNPQMWNAGVGSSDVERPPVDDVAFLHAVLNDLIARGADPTRVYMAGFSNGASMTFRFAAEASRSVAAIGTVAGHFRADGGAPAAEPVPLAHIFGRNDPLSPFDGGMVQLPWGRTEWRPPARQSAEAWARRNGLSDPPRVEQHDGYTVERWGEIGDPREVLFIAIDACGHVWPGGHRLLPEALVGKTCDRVSATAELWQFFSRRRR